jgi:hypothetical protein
MRRMRSKWRMRRRLSIHLKMKWLRVHWSNYIIEMCKEAKAVGINLQLITPCKINRKSFSNKDLIWQRFISIQCDRVMPHYINNIERCVQEWASNRPFLHFNRGKGVSPEHPDPTAFLTHLVRQLENTRLERPDSLSKLIKYLSIGHFFNYKI